MTLGQKTLVLLLFINPFLLDGSAQVRPACGIPVPELASLDSAMQDIMQANDIGAGVLALMKDNQVVYRRAFGWQDKKRSLPLRPDCMMRIASITKPFTAAAIRHLIASGLINPESQVFSDGDPTTGLLHYKAFGTRDARLADITVEHLLKHKGGWDRDEPGIPDHTYQEKQIANEMGVESPPSRINVVRWIMGKPLQFDPGTDTAYSNIGYLLLGLIVEETTGQGLLDYLEANVLDPIGISAGQVFYGRSFRADQDLREPYYDAGGSLAANVFFPAFSDEPFVERPYGNWNHEARIGQGAMVANPYAILSYLAAHQVNGSNIGGPRPSPGNWKWNHTGSLRGTNCLARQRGDGINYAVFFNKRPSSGSSYALQMRLAIDEIIESGAILSWPTADVRYQDIPIPKIRINADPTVLSFSSTAGRHYQLMQSTDLQEWTPAAQPRIGDDNELNFILPANNSGLMYYRVKITQ